MAHVRLGAGGGCAVVGLQSAVRDRGQRTSETASPYWQLVIHYHLYESELLNLIIFIRITVDY